MSAGITALYGPPPPQDMSPRWWSGTFGLGYGHDGRDVRLWCEVDKVENDIVYCSVINGAWEFTVDLATPNTGRVSRYPERTFTFNVLFHGKSVPFGRTMTEMGKAIAWMQAKVDAEVPK